MPDFDFQPLPFLEALGAFKAKGLKVSPDSFRDVWAAQHVQAFTVARVTAMDVLEDIRGEVEKALEKGVSLGTFKRDLSRILAAKGWLARRDEADPGRRLPPWRLETIYRTNMQAAYSTGRYQQMLDVAQDRPYWRYVAVMDGRTRPSHAAQNGKVFRFDHPFWDRWYPPNGYNCRCTVVSISAREMQRQGLREQTRGVSEEPDKGFDYNPGREFWQPDFNKYGPEARELLTGEDLTSPRNTVDLGISLTRWREALKNTGCSGSSAPIRVLVETNPNYNGSANYATGEIWINPDFLSRLNSMMQKGSIANQSEMDAFKTLVHEFGHHLGYPTDLVRYNQDLPYKILCQAINDLWARRSIPEMAKALKLSYGEQELQRVLEFHPTGYQDYVVRLREIIKKSGMDAIDEKALMVELNTTVSPEDYSERLWKEVRRKNLNIIPSGEFGDVLLNERRFLSLINSMEKD
jgi:SPP1 gp7 family putative phage head morphogenesis protein